LYTFYNHKFLFFFSVTISAILATYTDRQTDRHIDNNTTFTLP